MKRPLTPILVIIGILGFLANALYQMEKAGDRLPQLDVYTQSLPFQTFARQSVLAGSLPLWNPYQAMGRPFFAMIGMGHLYPINWAIFLLDLPHAMLLIQFVGVVVGMAGVVLYMRYLKFDWPAVTLATILFGFSVLAETFSPCVGATYCWLPVIFWLAHRLLDKPTFGACLALTLSLTLCFLAGFTQYFYYICIILSIYVLLVLLLSWSRYELKGVSLRLGLIGLAFLFTAGLVAVQFLPTLELSLNSVRNVTEQMDRSTMLLIKGFSPLRTLQNSISRWSGPSIMPYFGSSLLLVPFAFTSKKNRRILIALSATFGYALLFVLSKHRPALAIFGMIPFSDSFRLPERIIPLGSFAIAVLAGIGLSSLLDMGSMRLRNSQTGSLNWLLVLAALYTLSLSYPVCSTSVRLLFRSAGYIVIVLPWMLFASILLIFVSSYSFRMKGILTVAVLLVGVLSVILFKDMMYAEIDLMVVLFCIPLILLVVSCAFDCSRRMKRFAAGMAVGLIPLSIAFGSRFESTGYFICVMTLVLVFLLHAPGLPSWTRRLSVWAVMLLILFDVVPRRQIRWPVPATTKLVSADSLSDERVKWTKAHAGQDRVLLSNVIITAIINPNLGSMFQFLDVNNYDSLTLARWRNYVRSMLGPEEFDKHSRLAPFYGIIGGPFMELFLKQAQMVGLASLRYVVTNDVLGEDVVKDNYHEIWKSSHSGNDATSEIHVYENRFALPRTYLVNNYIITHGEQQSLQAIRDNLSELSRSVILEDGQPSFASADAPTHPGQARIDRYENDEVELHVEVQSPSLVILTDSYYPGWNAFVDGVRTPIWRANSLFRAVETPAGNHTVLFKYQPASLRWGAAISLGTLLLILLGLFIDRRYVGRRLTDADSACRIHTE